MPTLVVFGRADLRGAGRDVAVFAQGAQARLPQVTTRVIDGADHAMMLGVAPVQQVDAAFAAQVAPNAPAYFALLGAWLLATVGG